MVRKTVNSVSASNVIKVTPVRKKADTSDDSTSDENIPVSQKRLPIKKSMTQASKKGKAAESSSDSSSSSEDETNSKTKPDNSKSKTLAPSKAKAKQSSDSDSDSSSDEKSKKTPPVKAGTTAFKKLPKPAAKEDSDSSSSDSSSEEETASKPKMTPKTETPKIPSKQSQTLKNKQESSSDSSSSSDEEEEKKKTPSQKTPHSQKHNVSDSSSSEDNGKRQTMNGGPKSNGGEMQRGTPFRRVISENVRIDPRLKDNSFEAKQGARGSWGERANDSLKYTRGKGFRHEKTKKKRGSYRGGNIDSHSVHSIKFD